MFKKIFIVFVVVILVFIVVVSMQPNEFKVSRSIAINAPVSAVFAQVNNFHNWENWSPWLELDPNAKVTYEGPSSGVGAIFRWSGNNKVGEGSNTITESRPNEAIRIRLDFLKPFKGTSTAEFTFVPQGNQTLVTWNMFGKNNFMGKAMGLIMNCDKMIGGQFEKGLASLKLVVESPKK